MDSFLPFNIVSTAVAALTTNLPVLVSVRSYKTEYMIDVAHNTVLTMMFPLILYYFHMMIHPPKKTTHKKEPDVIVGA
jgi:hypothetical protein